MKIMNPVNRRWHDVKSVKGQKLVMNYLLKHTGGASGEQPVQENIPQCVICLEHINQGEIESPYPCEHVFHFICIHHWMRQPDGGTRCPTCRSVLDPFRQLLVRAVPYGGPVRPKWLTTEDQFREWRLIEDKVERVYKNIERNIENDKKALSELKMHIRWIASNLTDDQVIAIARNSWDRLFATGR